MPFKRNEHQKQSYNENSQYAMHCSYGGSGGKSPRSSLDYLSPQMYRDAASTPPLTANFLERFFRSAAARGTRVATPTLQSRYKNGLTSGDTEWYKKPTRLMYTKEGA